MTREGRRGNAKKERIMESREGKKEKELRETKRKEGRANG